MQPECLWQHRRKLRKKLHKKKKKNQGLQKRGIHKAWSFIKPAQKNVVFLYWWVTQCPTRQIFFSPSTGISRISMEYNPIFWRRGESHSCVKSQASLNRLPPASKQKTKLTMLTWGGKLKCSLASGELWWPSQASGCVKSMTSGAYT